MKSYQDFWERDYEDSILGDCFDAVDDLLEEIEEEKKVGSNFDRYLGAIANFGLEVLCVQTFTKDQYRILEEIQTRQVINVQAANSVGKTFLIAVVILYWVFVEGGAAYSTAPSLNQVKDLLWKEVRILYDKNKEKLGGVRGELFIKRSEEAKAIGYTARHTDANAFQGRHAEKLLLIQDEADGISRVIDEAFESCLTGSSNKGIRVGNPLTLGSAFYYACELTSLKIAVWSHPNVEWAYQEILTDNDGNTIHVLKPEVAAAIFKPEEDRSDKLDILKPVHQWGEFAKLANIIPGAVSVFWIEKMRIKYGVESIFWTTRIEACFPENDVSGIIPLGWLKQARARYDADPEYWDNLAMGHDWRIGGDVGDGVDDHCLAICKGPVLYEVKSYPTTGDRTDVIRFAKEIIEPKVKQLGGQYRIAIDNIGVGSGTLGTLLLDGYNARGCRYGDSANDPKSYSNLKTELHWEFRETLMGDHFAIAPLGEEEELTFEELAAVRYKLNTEKQIMCEKKAETKARLGRSPNRADGVILASSLPQQTCETVTQEKESSDISEEELIQKALEEYSRVDSWL
jgi:hypothetical protein